MPIFCDSDRRLEGILSGYTDEEPEVLEYKVNIRDEQKVPPGPDRGSPNNKPHAATKTTWGHWSIEQEGHSTHPALEVIDLLYTRRTHRCGSR